jgi:hypothetical protein
MAKERVLWKDSLLNSIPFLFTMFFWIGLLVVGMTSVQKMFTDEGFKNIGIIFWMIIMMMMVKYIQHPIISTEE